MAVTGSVFHLQSRFYYGNNGWTEKYYIKLIGGHSPGVPPIDIAQDILKRRVLWLGSGKVLTTNPDGTPKTWGKGPTLDLATLSLTDSAKDGVFVPIAGFDARPPNLGYDPINDRCSGPEFRFETRVGKWGNRILRGAPDAWMTDQLPQPPMPVDPAGTVDLLTGLLTPLLPVIPYATTLQPGSNVFPLLSSVNAAALKNLRASFLDAVVRYCGAIFKGSPVNPDPGTWTLPDDRSFVAVKFRQISDHRTGKRSDKTRARDKKRV